MPTFQTILAGANFRPASAKEVLKSLDEGAELSLERDAENPYDSNAVKVLLDEEFLGFVAKTDNPEVAQLLDDGAPVESVTVIGMAGTLKPILRIEF